MAFRLKIILVNWMCSKDKSMIFQFYLKPALLSEQKRISSTNEEVEQIPIN